MIDHEKLENVEYLKYMHSMMTNDAKCTRKITSKDCRRKSSIQEEQNDEEKEDSFHQETGTNVRKKLVIRYIISMALNGPKTWTFRKVIRNTLKVFKFGGTEGRRRSDGLIM
jgi:hypothetical protein